MSTTTHELGKGPITPWGRSELETIVAPGIIFHSTASQSGFQLDDKRQRTLMKRIPLFAPNAGAPWYEHTCDAHAVVISFPSQFEDSQVADSVQFVEQINQSQTMFPNNWTELLRWIKSESFNYLKHNPDPLLR